MDLAEILQLLERFAAREVEYVLIGGVALNLHGIGRPTEDVDFFVRPSTENIGRLREALREVYEDPSIDEISAEDLANDYPTVRYGPPHGVFFIDLIARLGDFAAYEDLDFDTVQFRGIPVRLATPQTLIWLKEGTVRERDRADARALREHFDLSDRSF